MNWNHVVFEAYCLFNEENNEVPMCCVHKPGIIGMHCFEYDEKSHKHCPYLALGKARTTIVLANENGDVVASKVYKGDDRLIDENLWLNAEREWIEKWRDRFLKDSR